MGGEEELLVWHVVRQLRINLPGSSYRLITPGWTYRVNDLDEMRKHNFVCWEKPVDALMDSRGMTMCRVRLRGKIVRGKREGIVGTELTVLWLGTWGRLLERFICDLAQHEIQRLRESGQDIDPLLDVRLAQKLAALENPHLREGYWNWDEEASKTEWGAWMPLPSPARNIVGEAISPFFVGQERRLDNYARQGIKRTLSGIQLSNPDIDTAISRLLTEAFDTATATE